jgi:hypothetical protein
VKKLVMTVGLLMLPTLLAAGFWLYHPSVPNPLKTTPTTLSGDFTLWAATPTADPCAARPDAPDIHAGAPVDVHDESGGIVAGAVLSTGTPEETHRGCVYHFTVAKLPVARTYAVQVGTRVGPTVTRAALAADVWRMTLNIGLPTRPGPAR